MKLQRYLLAGLWIAGASSLAHAQVFQLTREQCVRQDVPGLEPRLDWIRDDPPPINKQSFRTFGPDPYSPETVFVRFLPETTAIQRGAAHALAGIDEVLWQSRLVPDLYLVRIGARDVRGTVLAYLDAASTLYSEPNYEARLMSTPNDPDYLAGEQYGMGDAYGSFAAWAWDEWQGDSDFVVAIIDSGYALHNDLIPNRWINAGEIPGNGVDDDGNGRVDDWQGWDFGSGDNVPNDMLSDHGTHVAGIVGARGNNGLGVVGVNWRCKLMNLSCESPGNPGFITNTTQAIDYAVANGARVSNNSYGGDGFVQSRYDEIQAAQAFGHIFVTSAGNDYYDNDVTPTYPASYDLANVISVANTDDDGELYEVCNIFGGNCSGSQWGATSVDLGAPGVDIHSTVFGHGYDTKTGTSMSSPHVAGAVALVYSRYPDLEWWKIRDRILDSTTAEATLAGKCVTGGRLHTQRALGVWARPSGGGLFLGTRFNPYSASSSNSVGFPKAVSDTPRHGSLNIVSGVVSKAALPAGFGTKPMVLQASGGHVRIGVQ